MREGNSEEKLKKRIGFLGLLAMCVGLNIGGALFALTTVAAGLTGPSLPLAMLVSSIPALLAIIPYCALTSAYPTTSATYRYAQLFNPSLALVCMLSLAVCITIGGQPLFAKAFGVYFKELIPINPVVTGLVILTLFYLINLIGIQLTVRIQTIMFFILLSALVLYVVLGIPRVNPVHFDNPFPKGVGGIFAAAGLLFTFCAGGFFVVDLGGEVIRANKIFPKVLFIGMIIVISLYILITVVTVGVVETSDVKNQSLIVVAETFMTRPFLIFFIIGGALIACATTINIIFSIISRGLMVVAGEGLLPAFLGKVNDRFGTPHWGLTIAYLISSLSLIFIPSLMFFGSMLNLGLVFAITAVAISGMVLPKRYPVLFSKATINISPGSMKIVCIAVIAFNSLIFLFFGFAIGASSILFLGIVLLATLYALSRKRDLKEIRKKIEGRFQKAGA